MRTVNTKKRGPAPVLDAAALGRLEVLFASGADLDTAAEAVGVSPESLHKLLSRRGFRLVAYRVWRMVPIVEVRS